MEDIKVFLEGLSNENIWNAYALAIMELKKRRLVRTRNIVGERGEFLAIETYNNTPGLPGLQAAPEGTKNVDAISRKGERYSIKTITEPGKTTGVFYGCGNIDDEDLPNQNFEYILIVIIGKDFQLKNIYELTWDQFLNNRKWHSIMTAWNLSVTKKLLEDANKII